MLLCGIGAAEVIELEGTVKAVDAAARTITIERKTAKGAKTLELEVNRKAGDLSSVTVGDNISLSYDPDLELVTRLGSDPRPKTTSDAKENTACRLRVTISDTGEVTVGLGRPPDASAGDAGRAVTRTEIGDGSWKLQYGFGAANVLETYGWRKNVSVDENAHSLVMKPGPSDKGDYLSAGLAPRGRFRVPITVEIDTTSLDGASMLRLELSGGNVNAHGQHLFFLRSEDGFRKTALVEASTGQGENTTKHFSASVQLREPFEKSFRLPIPNVKNKDVYSVLLGAFYKGALRISRLSIQGHMVPTFGIGLDQQGGTIFAKQIIVGGLAERAGLMEGDVIHSINGDHPSTVADTMEKMMAVGFGKELTLAVRRGSEQKTFTLKAEWEE